MWVTGWTVPSTSPTGALRMTAHLAHRREYQRHAKQSGTNGLLVQGVTIAPVMAMSLITDLPRELREEIINRLSSPACGALAATSTSLSQERALRVRINQLLREAEAEFEAAREREAEMWFPNEGTGEMLVNEGASDWSEDEF